MYRHHRRILKAGLCLFCLCGGGKASGLVCGMKDLWEGLRRNRGIDGHKNETGKKKKKMRKKGWEEVRGKLEVICVKTR